MLTLTGPVLAAEPAEVGSVKVDFDRDVRPILSEHCFTCHGPDAGKLEAGLRLDLKESVFHELDSGATAVVAGKPEQSELIRRTNSADSDQLMPPARYGKALSAAQIATLNRWVAEGAAWSGHWSFEPLKMPPVPSGQLAQGTIANPIDAFVLAKLKTENLSQAPREEKARLIRRLALDLTGLPPSLKEVDGFLADDSEQAYEKVVDRLLGSQHFGERLAIPWLDLARYGDTSGYHNDSLRDMWLWREWVINAFNANMPFDQFTVEQLAGDLIPEATIQQQIASGFHRNVMTSDEGGLIDAEYRNLYIVDRIATTGVTWLGMTIACAQCHSHKYDPVSQTDYYRLYAFFNNVPENGKDGVRDRNPMPFLRVPSPEDNIKLEQYAKDLAAAEARLAELNKSLPERQAAWEQTLLTSGAVTEPIKAWVHFPLDENGDGLAEDGQPWKAHVHGEIRFTEGSVGKSFDSSGNEWLEYAGRTAFEKDQPFSLAAYVFATPSGGSPFGKMDDANGARGWDVEFHGLRPSVHLIHHWPDNAIHIQADDDLPANTFTHLAVTYDGSGKAAGLRLFINGAPAKATIKQDSLNGSIQNSVPLSIGRRGGASVPFTGRIDELCFFQRALSAEEVASLRSADALQLAKLPADQRTAEQNAHLAKVFQHTQLPELATLQKAIADLQKSKSEFESGLPNTMVMAEMPTPRDTFIKIRGNYDQDGEKVQPGVPAFLPQLSPRADGKPLNRLDLAKWLVAPDHPLTARVTVNRWWAMLFGTGIVKTLNDFGSQGERPSHPELLDWLAGDLMRDWDTKRVIKQIVMSATYQQTARVSSELLARDQENRLLARGPRQRLDAELLRDNALFVAGILNPTLGGRSIKPYQPEGTWEINEMSGYQYETSKGADLYRRGLYVYWRRSTVYPSFVTLDAPTREFCVAQRAKTSTPLQSLVLMNDPVFVEAARALAQRVLTQPQLDDTGRLTYVWRLALSRQPSASELAILSRSLQQAQAAYRQDVEAARKLISVGELPKPTELDDRELAAWTALSNIILNLNETISN